MVHLHLIASKPMSTWVCAYVLSTQGGKAVHLPSNVRHVRGGNRRSGNRADIDGETFKVADTKNLGHIVCA